MPSRFTSKQGPSQRQLRAGELLRHAIVEILQREDLREPALRNVSITVSEVRASPDLKQASVYCAPLGGALTGNDGTDAIKALNRAAGEIRHQLGRRIDLKFTPALKFLSDTTFGEAKKIEDLLADPKVQRDLDQE